MDLHLHTLKPINKKWLVLIHKTMVLDKVKHPKW
jgi:hypothetical protein